jgi:hypothetical protein
MNKKFEMILEWTATAVLLFGVYLTAFNIYPMNVYVSLAGNMLWLIVALSWRKLSIITVQFVISGIYIVGLIDKGLLT